MTLKELILEDYKKLEQQYIEDRHFSDESLDRLFKYTTILANLDTVECNEAQKQVSRSISDAMQNIDMSKFDLGPIKNLFKN